MKLKINREFLARHLFAFAVFAALGGWFGLDAFVRYPATSAHDLYVAIEKSEPRDGFDLEAFKAQKIATQKIFSLITLLVAAGVGLHILSVVRFKCEWDDEGFTAGGVRRRWSDITDVDTKLWESKNLLKIAGNDWKLTLDAWHHTGVKDFFKKVSVRG